MRKCAFLVLFVVLAACGTPASVVPQPPPSAAAPAQTWLPTMQPTRLETTGTPAFLSGIPVVGRTATLVPTTTTTLAPVTTSTLVPTTTNTLAPTTSPTAYAFVAAWFSVTENVNCRKGPNTFYNVAHVLKPGERLQIKGRTDPAIYWAPEVWLQIQLPASPALCWLTVKAGQADGNIDLLPPAGFPPLPDEPLNFRISSVCPEKGRTRTAKLSWTAMKNVSGYALYRKDDYADERLLATLAVDVTSFQDQLRLDHFYIYELVSIDENGTSGHVGAWVDICK